MTSDIKTTKEHSPWMVLITVIVGTLLIGLDKTVVNLGMPKMINDFQTTVSAAGWIATAYIISNAVFVPVFGKLGDVLGNKKIYFWSFVGFTLISGIAGLSWDLNSMVFFRVLQGLVGAAIFPTAMALIAKNFKDPNDRTQALGIWSASFAVSAVLGPLIGGPLIDNYSWRWLFYINIPIGIIGILMSLKFLPDDVPVKKHTRFDYKGSIALGVALTSLVLVLEKGRDWGWMSTESLISYAVMIIFSIIFYYIEKREDDPVVDLNLFNNRTFSMVLVLSLISFAAMMGSMFLLPVFAQTYLEFNATQTGMMFIPMALTMMISAPLGGYLSKKVKLKYLVSIGMAIASYGIYMFSGLDVKTTELELILPLVVFASGLGLGMAPMTAAATNSVPDDEVGVSSALLNLTRNIAGAVGIAFFSTLLSNLIESNVLQVGRDAVINTQDPIMIKTASALIILKAQIMAYANVFVVAALIMSTCIFIAFFLKDSKKNNTVEVIPAH